MYEASSKIRILFHSKFYYVDRNVLIDQVNVTF